MNGDNNMWIYIEGDTNILKQFNNCCSCLIRGFKCQDVLLRITDDEFMIYSFPSGVVTSCFQFSFSKRLFDQFTVKSNSELQFERLYNAGSLLNCFINTQWLKPTRFTLEIGFKGGEGGNSLEGNESLRPSAKDELKIIIMGRNGVIRKHRVYPVIGTQDRILFHEKIKWNRRHGIKMPSGLLKDIFNYMEMKDSLMTLSIDPIESIVSIKVNPMGPGCSGALGSGDWTRYQIGGTGSSNNSTYQDIQIRREQIETLYLCKDIIQNNAFTFNSREFKVAIALAENCQLPVFITFRSPGSPLIISIGQRAIIDQICINEQDDTAFPFEYHWSNILFQSHLYKQDPEYIEKTQTFSGFSAVFLMATSAVIDQNSNSCFLDFCSPFEDVLYEVPDKPDSSAKEGDNAKISSTQFELWSIDDEMKNEHYKTCSFTKLDLFNIIEMSNHYCLGKEYNVSQLSSSDIMEIIPPCDEGRKDNNNDWISTLFW
ncbi:hypothetical protein FG386_000958 [Cryptosporidium ryanae]|uniref:uncharacterized protein n=1 Tax=Cryptosporidium ryanae TaxID=515981 RepID=UPI00351A4406|nr:hypothetical protein FG386_000958 [Cryptosporidium ryanae]